MLKKQKIMVFLIIFIGLIGFYNVYFSPSNSKSTLNNDYTKNNTSDSKTIITKNININELSDEILSIESDIQDKTDKINDLKSEKESNQQKLKKLEKELKAKKTINIFNNINWYDFIGMTENYFNKKEQINLCLTNIFNKKEEIKNNEKEITNLEIEIKNLNNREDNLKDFISNNEQFDTDLINEVAENIDSKLIDKIKKDKIDNNQSTNNDLLTTLHIPESFLENNNNNMLSKRVGNLPPFIMPVHGVITSEFGYRIHPISGEKKYHSGTDIGVDTGTPVKASNYGLVIYSGWYSGFGNAVILSHADGVYTLYGHNSKLLVSKGDKVNQGQTIALAGSTGYSTGPHCHFSMWINNELVNPLDYVVDNN